MIITKILVLFTGFVISFALWCCMRISSFHNTNEDSDYLNYGMSIKELQKYIKKHKLVATINDGKILYLSKEEED